MFTGVRLPFLHGFLPRGPGQTFHLAHPPALPPHLHVLPGHQSIAEHHFQGFSAFRKHPSLPHFADLDSRQFKLTRASSPPGGITIDAHEWADLRLLNQF